MNNSNRKVKDTKQVAESYEKLYGQVPNGLTGQASTFTRKNSNEELKEFLQNLIPSSDQKDIDSELKKTVSLVKSHPQIVINKKINQKRQPRKCKKFLTSKERRELGLYRLPKKGLKYETYVELNHLWLGYIRELVDFAKYRPEDENIRLKLTRADYHGGLVKITQSSNPNLINLEGIILMETKYTFRIITKDNIVKTISKKNTVFTFRANDEFIFSVHGSNMIMKPSDRAVKKWKNKGPYEF